MRFWRRRPSPKMEVLEAVEVTHVHEGDYDAIGFWDEPVGGGLVLSASFGAPAHLGPDDVVMIRAGRLDD
jgi:hypothetical protein